MSKNVVGIIAGGGELPIILAESMLKSGRKFVVLHLKESSELDDKLKEVSTEIKSLSIAKVGAIIDFFKNNNVKDIVLCGGMKVPDFKLIRPDVKGSWLLLKLVSSKFLGDDSILRKVILFLEKNGFNIIGPEKIYPHIMINKSDIKKHKSLQMIKKYKQDIDFGVSVLKKIGLLDIGQAIVVQSKRILGIEAVEGTDKLIKRCSEYARKTKDRPILIKMSKDYQDQRVDMPSIGPNTINLLKEFNYGGIVVQDKKTICINKNEVIDSAIREGLFIHLVK